MRKILEGGRQIDNATNCRTPDNYARLQAVICIFTKAGVLGAQPHNRVNTGSLEVSEPQIKKGLAPYSDTNPHFGSIMNFSLHHSREETHENP
ncbi:hypothetical protein [Thiomicrorhabdus sp. 6S3-12]|uniref:hypothetical protein n=1 Tax=Thiomicrorhabdus sp. 6S3-12 TaxID=2819681 RepID=UPI001AADE5F3|nr:hypothetical protein [Thiomicrorhabdus sp. 6S3-12]MBO1923360.1 hypothetical protein [Thiomicrorhabdus sp. 6S3-12]